MTSSVDLKGFFKGATVVYHYNPKSDQRNPLVEDPRKYLTEGTAYMVIAIEEMNGQINIRVRSYRFFRIFHKEDMALEIPFFDSSHFTIFRQQ